MVEKMVENTKTIVIPTKDSNGNDIDILYLVTQRLFSDKYILLYVGIKPPVSEEAVMSFPKIVIPHKATSTTGEKIIIDKIEKDVFRTAEYTRNECGFRPTYKYGCRLLGYMKTPIQELEIESGIDFIADGAFSDAFIDSVIWPASNNFIHAYTFSGCKTLKKITGIENVEKIGEFAFSDTAFSKFIWPEKTSIVPAGCFKNAYKLKNIKFPGSIEKIELEAIHHTKVERIDLRMSTAPIIKISKYNDFFIADVSVYSSCSKY